MTSDRFEEHAVGTCLVLVRAERVDLPGVSGWIGAWEIYRLPWHSKKAALRIGETDVERSEAMALGMARTIAVSVARAL
jgi:hypothetical protein